MAVVAKFKVAGLSDSGRKRDNNEDRFHFDPERGIYFVIDGVGGHAAGEKAADTAYNLLRARLERPTGSPAERIREAITLANNEIFELSQSNVEWEGMACVLTVAVVEDSQVTIGHVGDSRLYLIQNGEMRKLTHDHSPVGEREDRGEIDELTAMRHPRRNEVYRDVGSEGHAPDDPDFIELTTSAFGPTAALLLCSDGLTDLIPSAQILAIVEAHAGQPKSTARALIDAANEAGGKDNITVVLVEGPQFSSSSARPRQSDTVPGQPPAPPSNPLHKSRVAFALLGFILPLLLVALLRPHWRITESGTVFGLGAVREPHTWRVSGNITAALQSALPGDTVLVAPGTYPEQIRLKSGVRLASERPREAVLQTSGVAISATDVDTAVVDGFRIITDEGQPLTIGIQLENSDVEVTDMEITGAQTAAIDIAGTSGGNIRANTLSGNPGIGISVRDAAKPRIIQNVIVNNGRGEGGNRPGIQVAGSAQPILNANTIHGNGAGPISAPQLNLESLIRQNYVSGERGAARQQAIAAPRANPAEAKPSPAAAKPRTAAPSAGRTK